MRSNLILRTYLVLCIGHVSTKAVAFVTAVLMGRMVGPAEMGVFATALTLTSLALVLVNGGSDLIAIRRVATSPKDASAALSSVVLVRLCGSTLIVLLLLALSRFFGPYQKLVLPLGLALLAYVFRLDWLLLVRDRARWITVSTICREGAYLILVVLLVSHAKSAASAAWAFCIAEWIWSGMTLVATKSWHYWPKFQADWRAIPGSLRVGWPIAAMALLNLTYNKIDTPMVAAIVGPKSAGVYWAAYSIIFGLMGFSAVLTRAAFPEMARDGARAGTGNADQVLRFCTLTSLVGGGFSVLLSLSSTFLMIAAFGKAFAPGAAALSILGWCLWPSFASGLLTHWLIARGLQVRVAGVALGAVLTNLALNSFMIPLFGIQGAAITSVAAEICVLAGALYWLREIPGTVNLIGSQLWIAGAGVLVTLGAAKLLPAGPASGLLALAAYALLCVPVFWGAIRTTRWMPHPTRGSKGTNHTGVDRARPKVLALVQLPPPLHGVSQMNRCVVESGLLGRDLDLHTLELPGGGSIAELGRFRVEKLFRSVLFGLRLATVCARLRPDLVYFTVCPTGAAFARDLGYIAVLKAFGLKRVFHLHGHGVESASNGLLGRAIYRWAFRGATVIYLSEAGKADIAEVAKGSRVVLVPNGVEDLGAHSWPMDRRNRTEVPRILFLSNMLEKKGALVLLEALGRVASQGISFHASFIGAPCDENVEREFLRVREGLGLCGTCSRLPAVDGEEKRRAFHESDVFVFPSYYDECFPLVILEAMSAGVPVITTRHAATSEVVIQGETGLVVERRSVDELADAIARLLSDPDARLRMGSAGRARYLARYTSEIFESRLHQILHTTAGVSLGMLSPEPLSLAIFQRVVPEYRVRVFERIAEQTNYNITLYATRFAAKPAGVECREVGEIPLGRLRVHPKVVSTILRGRHDVFLCEGSISLFASLSAAVRAFRRGTALVWWTSMWRPNGVIGPGRGARRLFVHRVLRAADAVATYSGVAAEVVRAAGVPEDRIFVAYNSLDTAHLREAEREWNAEGKLETFRKDERLGTRPTILFVGRLIREKRVRDLLRAVKRLSATEDFELLIVGDGPDRRTCERLAKRLELERHVRFLGEIRDEVALCPYFLSARALVLPGPGGLAINQAFTYGLPVIVGRGDGTERDLIVDGENGFVLPNGSAEAIADGMARILALTESEHRSFSRAARERVDRVANVDTMVTGLIDAVRAARSMKPVRT